MTTYVIRNGALIEKHLAGPLAAGRSAQVISDIARSRPRTARRSPRAALLCDYDR